MAYRNLSVLPKLWRQAMEREASSEGNPSHQQRWKSRLKCKQTEEITKQKGKKTQIKCLCTGSSCRTEREGENSSLRPDHSHVLQSANCRMRSLNTGLFLFTFCWADLGKLSYTKYLTFRYGINPCFLFENGILHFLYYLFENEENVS